MRLLCVALGLFLSACATQTVVSNEDKAAQLNALTTLALGYINQGSFDRAVDPVQRALDIDPSYPEAMLAQAVLLERQGDTNLAKPAYEKLLSANPDFTRGRQIFANFLFTNDQLDQACEELAIVVTDTLYANRARAFENLGVCRDRQGLQPQATDAFSRAFRLNPRLPVPNLELAERRFDEGDTQSAAFHYRQYTTAVAQNARSLWLGIRLAAQVGDLNSQASYELALRNRFPNSTEFNQWQEWKGE